MKVILTQDVPNLGLRGEIKDVANGYGRNFLMPQNLATLATPTMIKSTETQRNEATQRRKRAEEEMVTLAERLDGTSIELKVKAGIEKRLYGSITRSDIARAINANTGTEIDKRKVILAKPIRLLGTYDVVIRLAQNATFRVKVTIQPEEEPEAEAETTVTADVEAEAEVEIKPETQPEAEAEVTATTDIEAEPEAEIEPETQPEAEAEITATTDIEAETEIEIKPKAEVKPEVQPEAEAITTEEEAKTEE